MQTAWKVPKDKCEILHQCIKEVIEKSLEVGADSSQFPENWIFHSREKKSGKDFVEGKKIDFITVGGRTSACVPELQKLEGTDAAACRSKRRNDKGENDDTRFKKSRNAIKNGKKEAKRPNVDSEEEEVEKPAKKSKKPVKVKGSLNKPVITNNSCTEEDEEDEEAMKLTKRGRKQPVKVVKSTSKKGDNS